MVTSFTMNGKTKNWTCFNQGGSPPFGSQWGRAHIGCENGKLHANENCVPHGLEYITQAQFDAGEGSWTYPMDTAVAMATWEDGTSAQCGCMVDFDGPGCYVASNRQARFGGSHPAVFVKIDGTCPTETPEKVISSVAENPVMTYSMVGDSSIVDQWRAECDANFDEDVAHGTKLPDSCCDGDLGKTMPGKCLQGPCSAW